MKRIILLLTFFGWVTVTFAQQDPYYTHYMFNRLALNPAYAGKADGLEATLLHHQQWVGYPNSAGPRTQVLGINAPLGAHGLGVHLVNDRLGYEKSVNVMASYNYSFRLGEGHSISAGPAIGFLQKSIDGDKLTPEQAFDLKIPAAYVSSIKPDFSFGLYYRNNNWNGIYVGLSSLHLSQEDFNYESTPGTVISYKGARHFYLTGGMSFALTPNLAFRPNVLMKHDGATTQFDVNADLLFRERFRGGVSYRSGDAFSLLVGAYVRNGLHIGYSYDITMTDIRKVSTGTHELVINYVLKRDKKASPAGPTRLILTPRNLY